MSQQLSGLVVTPAGTVPGRIRFGESISAIEPLGGPLPDRFIVPGFIDVHVHGGGGGDTMDGADGVRTMAQFHLQHGTTTMLPTTVTNPVSELLEVLAGFSAARAAGGELPDLPGVHLEGPFISPERLGAQPPFATEPRPEPVSELLAPGLIRVVTLAPELPGAAAAAHQFARAGVRVSLGHSSDDGSATRELLDTLAPSGAVTAFTHLFNAMGGIEARRPGLATLALLREESYAEVILDRLHLHDDVLRLVLSSKPGRVMAITDAMRAAGLGDGPTELGGQAVTVTEGQARLADGTLAGSVLTMDQALRNALAIGLDWAAAVELTSAAPARYLGLSDRGSLEPGRRADLVVFDADLNVSSVWLRGQQLV